MHNHKEITSGGFTHGDPALLVDAMIGVGNRAGEGIDKHRHGLMESDAVLGGIACCLRRVPVELDPHRSQLTPERTMLERGEQCLQLGKMGAVLSFELIDLGDAGSEGVLESEGRKWKRNIHHSPKAKIAIDNAFGQTLRLAVAI